MPESAPLVDMSYIEDISGNDPFYINEVTGIFLDTMKAGLPKLEALVTEGTDFDAIHKQAHFLKSSASIIKVRDNYDSLVKIDALSRQGAGLPLMQELMQQILSNFNEALPVISRIIEENAAKL